MATPEGKVKHGIASVLSKSRMLFGVDCFFWYNSSTGIFDPSTKRFRRNNSPHSILGVADILGLLSNGQFIAIEVKSAKGRLSIHQKAFLAKVEQMNGIAIVAYSVDDFVSKFKKIIRPDLTN